MKTQASKMFLNDGLSIIGSHPKISLIKVRKFNATPQDGPKPQLSENQMPLMRGNTLALYIEAGGGPGAGGRGSAGGECTYT